MANDDPAAGLALGDLQVTPLPVDTQAARMDLAFSLSERWSKTGEPAGISGMVEFRTDVFDAASIEALVERLQRVLVAMTADAGAAVVVGGSAGRARARAASSDRQSGGVDRSRRPQVSIPALFAAQVARTPRGGGGQLRRAGRGATAELDEAANRLAHLLVGHGAGPGECVGLVLPRSAEAIVAMLAVLKTGAAYLPIDPALPAARIGFMLGRCRSRWRRSPPPSCADRLDGFDVVVIDVERSRASTTQPGTALPAPAPEDIAYVIYTSGTTGVPKGVAVTHRNVTQLLASLDARPAARRGCGAQCIRWRSTSRCGRSWARCCTAAGWWWCPSRWRARRKTSTPCWSPNASAC